MFSSPTAGIVCIKYTTTNISSGGGGGGWHQIKLKFEFFLSLGLSSTFGPPCHFSPGAITIFLDNGLHRI